MGEVSLDCYNKLKTDVITANAVNVLVRIEGMPENWLNTRSILNNQSHCTYKETFLQYNIHLKCVYSQNSFPGWQNRRELKHQQSMKSAILRIGNRTKKKFKHSLLTIAFKDPVVLLSVNGDICKNCKPFAVMNIGLLVCQPEHTQFYNCQREALSDIKILVYCN